MRSLLLATAGHVHHGKSTLLFKLSGVDPNRLPQEKARGMTLDLGFIHVPGISFVDVPGHEGLVRHTIAGQSGVDGALFVVAYNEGIQEQSREHARILSWLGIEKILIVVTKTDLAESAEALADRGKKIVAQVRELFSGSVNTDFIYFSETHDPQVALLKIKTFFSPERAARAFFSSRFFIDRAFTLNGIGTVVTGTQTEGKLQKGTKARLWFANGKKPRDVIVKSLRKHETPLEESAELGRLALVLDGVKPNEIGRGSCLLWGPNSFPVASHLALKMHWLIPPKKEMEGLLQVGTLVHQTRLRLHPKGFWRATPEIPLPLRRGDTILIRVPNRIKNTGHTIASGLILDAQLPAGKISVSPPEGARDFARWCRESGAGDENILQRLGLNKKEGQELLVELLEKPQAPPQVQKNSAPLDLALLQSFREGKWEAHAARETLDSAHKLVKAGRAHCVRDNHFLHEDFYAQLLEWLNVHFSQKSDLTVDDARAFFKTGRKNFLEILEFCDRHQFTFRKDSVRKRFKLPSYSRPSAPSP